MKSSTLGKNTSAVKVVRILKSGFRLRIDKEELFLSFKAFPWFKKAKAAAVSKVVLLHRKHLYWPELDVDLEVESLRHPGKYPLTYQSTP